MDPAHIPADGPLRVLYVSPGADARGGAEKSLLGLLDGLDRTAVEPSAVVLGQGSMVDALRSRGVATTGLDLAFRGGASYGNPAGRAAAFGVALRSLARATAAVCEAIDRNGAAIVHTNGMRGHLLLPAVRRRGTATVASIRELPRSSSEAFLLRGVLRAADSVIATSAYVARQFSFARNLHVIDNPICAPQMPDRDEARQALDLPPDAFVVAMLAHFHWWKGHLDLLRAVEPLDDVWVILAGGDLYGTSSTRCRNELQSFAQSHGMAHRVRCVGAIDDIGPVYAAADVVAHCSVRPEPFGRTIVEAALARKPVIASAAGAPGELIEHDRTGLLFAPGATEELRGHLISLRDQPESRDRLSRAAYVAMVDRFDPRLHASRVLTVYQSAIRSHNKRELPLGVGATAGRQSPPPPPRRSGRRSRLHRWSPIGSELGPTLKSPFARWLVSRVGVLNVGQRVRAQLLLSVVDALPYPRLVLDIGCGRGLNTLLLARRFPEARVIGVDVDPAAIEVAQRVARAAGGVGVEFALADPADDAAAHQADLVVCMDVLEHVVDDEQFALDLLEEVAPEGSLVVHVPLRGQRYLFRSVREARHAAISAGRDPHVREGYIEADLTRLFRTGFRQFETRRTLGGMASVVADLEAVGALRSARLPRLAALAMLPLAGRAGRRWPKGVLAVGRRRLRH